MAACRLRASAAIVDPTNLFTLLLFHAKVAAELFSPVRNITCPLPDDTWSGKFRNDASL